MGKPLDDHPPSRPNDTWIRRVKLPVVSGKATAAVIVACLVVAGLIVFPLTTYFQFPTWVRVEIFLGVWWVVWVIALCRLLYSGRRLSDDHVMGKPRDWVSWMFGKGSSGSSSSGSSWWYVPIDAEGCAWVLAAIVAFVVGVLALWLLIEIAIPAIAFLLYFLVRGMLARVANDDHGCKDNLPRSLAWACTWATLYLAPVAFLVWLGHVYWMGKPPGAA
jgi:hypothetical protein